MTDQSLVYQGKSFFFDSVVGAKKERRIEVAPMQPMPTFFYGQEEQLCASMSTHNALKKI